MYCTTARNCITVRFSLTCAACCLQTEEQYMFLHDALVEAIQSGNTCIPAGGVTRYVNSLQAAGGPEHNPWFLLHHQMKVGSSSNI